APVNKPTPPPATKKPAAAPAKAPAAAAPKPAEADKAPPDKAPAPAPAKAAAGNGSADEDIAAMLLSLQDDDKPSANLGTGEIPEGSTVMEMVLPSEMGGEGQPKADEKPKPAGSANTSSAAKAILEKYMRRPR